MAIFIWITSITLQIDCPRQIWSSSIASSSTNSSASLIRWPIWPFRSWTSPFTDVGIWHETFAAEYFRASGDAEGRALLALYAGYRAMVRGMVEGLELAEKEIPEVERTAAQIRARAHWLLALTELAEPAQKPCLLWSRVYPAAANRRWPKDWPRPPASP